MTAYLAALRGLADTCGFGANLEEALQDQFVLDIRRETIPHILLSTEVLTLKHALDIAYGTY